jgi:hypothetical protein
MDDEGTMRLERRHPGQIFTVQREMRHPPFDVLAKAGDGGMDHIAQMDQDRAGEIPASSI